LSHGKLWGCYINAYRFVILMAMSHSRWLMVIVALLGLCVGARGGEVEEILSGVKSVAAPGLPGTVCAVSPGALVVVDAPVGKGKGASRQAVIAAARRGKGTAVLFGHDGYFDQAAREKGDTAPLLLHLIRWAGKKEPVRVGVVGVRGLADYLKKKGVEAELIERAGWGGKLSGYGVVFVPLGLPRDEGDVKVIRKYLDGGGAGFFAGTGWGWLQTHAGRTLAENPTNGLLADFGLALGDGTIEREGKSGLIAVEGAPSRLLNAKAALDRLVSSGGGGEKVSAERRRELAQAAQTVMSACRAVAGDSAFMKELGKATAGKNLPMPSPARPLREADGLSRVMLTLALREAEGTPVEQVKASAAAKAFPGEVPGNAQRVTRTVEVDPRVPRWHSTGLYAAPGEVITVTRPADRTGGGYRVRIGAHTDRTYHLAAWHRAPEISRVFKLEQARTKAANAFGGLIYIEVPQGAGGEKVAMTIAGGVAAPYFVLGKTTPAAWRESIRNAPAPWGELATDKLILTVRSDVLRTLDDPTAVLEHWNKVMDATATLAGWPLERKSPERIVPDADISAGYMHSGYPIMTGLDVIPAMVDLAKLKKVNGGWGFYHEIGHNHQNPDWTFAGTTEVTVNLFTMHTLETVCGVSKEEATRRALVGPAARIKRYLAKPDFAAWQADPFLALAMYAQMRMEFGWGTYQKVFAEYRALKPGERPKTDAEKRDQWLVLMSRATGRNLGPFFQAWGIPTSAGARQAVAGLPGWMPGGMGEGELKHNE
jgi:hypothetical protein